MSVPQQNYRVETTRDVVLKVAGHEPVVLDLSPDRPDYVTTEGVPVWIERKVQKTRYLDAEGNQVGPWHKNFVPAIVWAIANGWRDPSSPDWWNDELAAEVAAGGNQREPWPDVPRGAGGTNG